MSTTILDALEFFQQVISHNAASDAVSISSRHCAPQHPTRNTKGVACEDAKHIKLFAMNPPIVNMDGEELGKLKNCECVRPFPPKSQPQAILTAYTRRHMALSTNNIERIHPIGGMSAPPP